MVCKDESHPFLNKPSLFNALDKNPIGNVIRESGPS